ncbi:TonB-dependent siderophore receptor [Telmatobacter bradus]|uniref:TonB-dependent siderophore receptor n=1 Tax=Telmatobacter bradus TaxID=474953 RepID=UPI003B42E4D3
MTQLLQLTHFHTFKKLPLAFLFLLCAWNAQTLVAAPLSGSASETVCSLKTGAAIDWPVTVSDAQGAALAGAQVRLSCGTVVLQARTNATGQAEINAQPGRWQLSVEAPGFATNTESVVLDGPTSKPLAVRLRVASASDTVTVVADAGFIATTSNTGSKLDVPLIEVPQSISVVNREQLEARAVDTVNAALYYTPGVETDQYGVEQRYDWMLIRGFSADTYGIFRDGMRWNSLAGKMDPNELESVEVLKGPSSVLYGEAPPGGLVNLVTRRPPQQPVHTITGEFGSYDHRQVVADFGGPLPKNKSLTYRLTGLVRNSGTQVNYTPDDRRLIAPALSWRPSAMTDVTLLGDWQHDQTRWSQFLPASGTLYNNNPNGLIPISTFVGEPDWEHVYREQASLGWIANHRFADGWTVAQNFRFQHINFEGSTVYGLGFDGTSTTMLSRSADTYPQINDIYTLDTRTTRHFRTGNWEHTFLGGYDFVHMMTQTRASYGAATDINVYHPVYGGSIGTLTPYNYTGLLTEQHGGYLQDQIKLRNKLVFTLGGREDWAISDDTNHLTPSSSTHQNDSKFTGRAGVTYLASNGIAPYFSYSTSFQPTSGTNYYGQAYKPSDGKQEEVGVKIQPHTWNGFVTASYFNIDQTNVQTTDPNNPLNTVQTAQVNSRGVELEALANVARGLNLHGGYSLVRTDTGGGLWEPQAAKNQASLLADYTTPSGKLAGLGGNLGVRFVGRNFGDSANTLSIPGFTLLDAALRTDWRLLRFSVNVSNLLDRRYIATCTGTAYCDYGYARDVKGSVQLHF